MTAILTNDLTDQINLDDEVMCQLLKKYNFRVVNDIYSILTKLACYGSRPFMDNNSHNCCDNHHSSTAKAGLCDYSNWPICSI